MKLNSHRTRLTAICIASTLGAFYASPLLGHEPYSEIDSTSMTDEGCEAEIWVEKNYVFSEGRPQLATINVLFESTRCPDWTSGCMTLDIYYFFQNKNTIEGWGGPNQFRVSNGSAQRVITDITQYGTAKSGRWSWSRFHNTVLTGRDRTLGLGGGWRHSWEYELLEKPKRGTKAPPPRYQFVSPSGFTREFFPTETPGHWESFSMAPEKLIKTNEGFEYISAENTVYKFHRISSREYKDRSDYQLRATIDEHGLTTTLEYNSAGRLEKITEPSGASYTLIYDELVHDMPEWTRLAVIKKAPAPQEWVEISVPEHLQEKNFRYLWICGRSGTREQASSLKLASVELYSTDEVRPLSGTALGTSANAQYAFDDDTTSIYSSALPRENICQIDLGENRSKKITRIRILPAPGTEKELVGASIAGLTPATKTTILLKEVQASNGRKVTYDYEVIKNLITLRQYPVLAKANYGDNIQASYSYLQQTPTANPALAEADDPQYAGMAKRIRYSYHNGLQVDDLGAIHQEIDPVTGNIYASYEVDAATPEKKEVRYAGGKTEKYTIPPETYGRPTSFTNSSGKTYQYDYLDGGKGAHIQTKTPDGANISIEYNESKKISRIKKNGVIQSEFNWDEKGKPLSLTSAGDRKAQSTWDEHGYLINKKNIDGSSLDYEYDSLGRVIKFTDRDGVAYRIIRDNSGLVTELTDDKGLTTNYKYNKFGEETERMYSNGASVTTERNSRGLPVKIRYSSGKTQMLEYDNYGRIIADSDADGGKTLMSYDGLSRLVEKKAANGETTRYEYSPLDSNCSTCGVGTQPTVIYHPNGSMTKIIYNSEGKPIQQIDRSIENEESILLMGYDDSSRLVSISNNKGEVARYAYDDIGRRISATKPNGEVILWSYDEKGERHQSIPVKHNDRQKQIP